MAVIYSCFAVLLLASLCQSGTIRNRPVLPVQPNQIDTQNIGNKPSGRRIMHPAFANAGRKPGLEIWRIENFEPVPYPQNNYGKFFTGDSFIILNTVESKDKKLSWDLHFWLGSETSVDEAGAAAILSVQLDDLLNGAPVQHREVQDHESSLFLSYFKKGIRYEKGGVGSGFKHVETNAGGDKRLFHVKGKRNVRVREVNLSISSMNKGDCFILDAGNDIYVYVGSKAKRVEKLKAISAANQIRDQDHNGRARVQIIDEFSTDSDKEHFFNVLGSGSANQVPEESAAEEDGIFETKDANLVALYKVSDASGKMNIEPISRKPLRQEMLETSDCFILDTGSGIYVWVGRGATKKEKTDAMAKAQEFLTTKKYPAWTQIHRIVEGAESAPFKQYFATWKDAGMAHTRLIRSALGYDSDDSEIKLDDIDSMLENIKERGGRAMGFMPDNGEKDIIEVIQYYSAPGSNDIQKHTIQFSEFKQPVLLGFSCYIITYKYETKSGQFGTLIYDWEGLKATNETKERAFEDAMNMAIEENGILIRTVQNHELRHFLKIFKGKLLTVINTTPTDVQLFHIRGTDKSDVHGYEVKADSSSLSSSDVFVVLAQSENKIYVWNGLAATELEKKVALDRFTDYWSDAEIDIIDEDAEPDNFWKYLNGEGVYDRSLSEKTAPILEPRLYHCHLVNNHIRTEEVAHFHQNDLDIDDVMLLDAGDEIYMWVGSEATTEENGRILDMAKKYIKNEPTQRSIDTLSVIRVTQGNEPQAFKRLFPTWDNEYWQSISSYEEIRQLILDENIQVNEI